jgi:hypothetical protein
MEKRDYDLAKLEQDYEKQIDGLLCGGYTDDRRVKVNKAEWDYTLAQGKIQHDFEVNTSQYKARTI